MASLGSDAPSGVLGETFASWVDSTCASSSWASVVTQQRGADVVAHVHVRRGHRDNAGNRARTSMSHVSVPVLRDGGSSAAALSAAVPMDATAHTLAPSNSSKWIALFRKDAGGSANPGTAPPVPRQVVELWLHPSVGDSAMLCSPVKTIALDSKVHGEVLADAWFASVSWSPDDRYLAFVAESRAADTLSFFDPAAAPATDAAKVPTRGAQYEWDGAGGSAGAIAAARETWGERYESVRQPRVCVLDVRSGRVAAITPPAGQEAASTGQPTWLRGSDGRYVLAYTLWSCADRRLGMIYCYHRPARIVAADVTALLAGPSGSAVAGADIPVVRSVWCTSPDTVSRTPQPSPDGRACAFLRQAGPIGLFVHNFTSELCVFSCEDVLRLLDAPDGDAGALPAVYVVVRAPPLPLAAGITSRRTGQLMPFAGLHVDGLSDDCWAADSGGVWLTTCNFSQSVVLFVRIPAGGVEAGAADILLEDAPCHDDSFAGDRTLLAAAACPTADHPTRALLLLAMSSPVQPETLVLQVVDDIYTTSSAPRVLWILRSNWMGAAPAAELWPAEHPAAQLRLDRLGWAQFPLCTPIDVAGGPRADAMLLYLQASETALPLVVFPHGGPHSVFSRSWYGALAFLALQGFAILFINYRGSHGFGPTAMADLPGRIGEVDVDDCMEAVHAALALSGNEEHKALLRPGTWEAATAALPQASAPRLDAQQVVVTGGSHGGFLTAHLIARAPALFRAAAMRNPVCNVAAMVSMSDIPDWCVMEACGVDAALWDGRSTPRLSPAIVARMFEVSPISRISAVHTPTLLLLGLKDRRVPPSDGLNYAYALKAAGVPCRVLMYPEDCHALDKPGTEADVWLNVLLWFRRWLETKPTGNALA